MKRTQNLNPVHVISENYLVNESLQQAPSFVLRGLLYVFILLIAIGVFFSFIAKIDVITENRAIAAFKSSYIKVLTDKSCYLEKVLIAEGKPVKMGDPMFQIRSRETISQSTKIEELKRLIPMKKELYNSKGALIRAEISQADQEIQRLYSVKDLKTQQNSQSSKSIESDLNFWKSELDNAAKELEDSKKLFDKNLISVQEYNSVKTQTQRAKTEIEKLTTQANILSRERLLLEEDTKKSAENLKNKKENLLKEAETLNIELESAIHSYETDLAMNRKMIGFGRASESEDTMENESTNVFAPNDGIIFEVFKKNPGEYLRESEVLCTILPATSALFVDISITNKDAGQIEPGMTVKYKFDAFPYVDFGVLTGKIETISPSAIFEKESGFCYHAWGSISSPSFSFKGKTFFVKPGMTSTAEIITEKKSVFEILVLKTRDKF